MGEKRPRTETKSGQHQTTLATANFFNVCFHFKEVESSLPPFTFIFFFERQSHCRSIKSEPSARKLPRRVKQTWRREISKSFFSCFNPLPLPRCDVVVYEIRLINDHKWSFYQSLYGSMLNKLKRKIKGMKLCEVIASIFTQHISILIFCYEHLWTLCVSNQEERKRSARFIWENHSNLHAQTSFARFGSSGKWFMNEKFHSRTISIESKVSELWRGNGVLLTCPPASRSESPINWDIIESDVKKWCVWTPKTVTQRPINNLMEDNSPVERIELAIE